MNLGSIGYVVGHEMTHGFDDVGRNFDQSGSMRDWWDPQTKVKFINKAMCVVDQYSNYTEKSVGLKVSSGTSIKTVKNSNFLMVDDEFFLYRSMVDSRLVKT